MSDAPAGSATPLVLVVDDEATQRLLTRDCLERDGFRVLEAADGDAALAMMQSYRPDVVLLDLMMPGRDGFAILAAIRANEALQHVPVIVVTGLDDTAAIERSFAVQATDFVTKPVLWALLPHRVRFVLRAQQLRNELQGALLESGAASRAKTEFLANMSHELRTPLNAIIGFADMIAEQVLGPLGNDKYQEYVADIQSSGRHLLGIVTDILDLVRIETGALKLEEDEVRLSAMVEAALSRVERTACETGITVVNRLDPDGPSVLADERRLIQIVGNLAANAVKFSPAGGQVEVRFEAGADGGGAIAISDTGPGIAASELPRLMQPFQQLDNGLTRGHDGVGLGMPIARAMARLHGGDLAYDSAPGRGTTVRLHLPASRFVRPKLAA